MEKEHDATWLGGLERKQPEPDERDKKLCELLALALETPEAERAKTLHSAEPDRQLVADALALLNAEAPDFLESPLHRLESLEGQEDGELPLLAGYTVLRLLGEGGMGRVYLATEDGSDGRQVAIKMLRARVPGRHLMQRFATERQALSRLNHPAIAQLFAAGTTADGRPFVVMEYIEGRPITRFCDKNRLGFRPRLELFVEVCRGVEHAHNRQLLHRDLKPSNLLVTTRDGKPAAKIIDFGIARVLDSVGSDAEGVTGALTLGTPAYMSPEALAPLDAQGHRDLDTRADVYSLGVVLYELLVGMRPHGETARSALVLMRQIIDQEVQRPSLKWRSMGGETRAKAVQRRGVGVEEVGRALSGDLDWIVMKAIERERDRRYGSAGALAADVERFLRREPIEARSPTLLYRLSCLARRHRAAAVATSLALLFLVLGAIGATFGMVRARQAEAEAKAEAQRAHREAETASRISDVLASLFSAADPRQGGASSTMKVSELLERGTARIRDNLNEEPAIQARLYSVLGDIYRVVGDYERSRELLARALELWQTIPDADPYRLGQTLNHLAVLDRAVGRFGEAEGELRRALLLWEEVLGPENEKIGGLLNNLGNVEQQLGRYEEAAATLQRALAIREKALGPDHRDVGIAVLNLGNVWNQLGNDQEALVLYRRAEKIFAAQLGPDHPYLGVVEANIADSLADLGRYEEAEKACREGLRIRQAAFGSRHASTAKSLSQLGHILTSLGRPEEAKKLVAEAQATLEALLGPNHPEFAVTLIEMSRIQLRLAHRAEALEQAQRAVAILESQVSADESNLKRAREAVAAAGGTS